MDTSGQDTGGRASRSRTAPKRYQESVIEETSAATTKQKRKITPSSKKSATTKKTSGGIWNDEEHAQFETGCAMHGWGNWKMIAEAVPTRDRAQCKSHAQKFLKHNKGARTRLDREYAKVAKKEGLAPPKMKAATTGGARKRKPANNDTVEPSTKKGKPAAATAATKKKPASAKTVKSTGKGEKKTGWGPWTETEQLQFRQGCILHGWGQWGGIEEFVTTRSRAQIKSHAQKFLKNRPDEKALYELEHKQLAQGNGSGSLSTETEKVAAKKKPQVKANAKSPKTKSATQAAEAILSLNLPEAAASANDEDLDVKVSATDNAAPSLPSNPTAGNQQPSVEGQQQQPVNSQPPPHWLAAETWEQCLVNIHRWSSQLSEAERNAEYHKYESLPDGEKERLRLKLIQLMANRPNAAS